MGPDGFAKSWKCDTKSGFEVDETNQDLVDLSLWMERCGNERRQGVVVRHVCSRGNW